MGGGGGGGGGVGGSLNVFCACVNIRGVGSWASECYMCRECGVYNAECVS